jgi:uncharacterized membrane protein
MCVRTRSCIMAVMTLAFQIVLDLHIVAGAVALLVFWVPLVTKKGGRTHRRFGWLYVGSAATVAVTGIASCVRLMGDGRPGHWRAGIFLAYVGLLAGESALLGVRALRTRRAARASRSTIDFVLPLLLVAGGVALAAFGATQHRVLFVLFASLGLVLGAMHMRFWVAPLSVKNRWMLAHMNGMGTSCITTVTAFVVVNAQRFGMRTFDLPLWVVPIALLGTGLALWQRRYARRLADAPNLP